MPKRYLPLMSSKKNTRNSIQNFQCTTDEPVFADLQTPTISTVITNKLFTSTILISTHTHIHIIENIGFLMVPLFNYPSESNQPRLKILLSFEQNQWAIEKCAKSLSHANIFFTQNVFQGDPY